MKNTPPDDPNSKALRDRYKRLLGLNQNDVVLEGKDVKDNNTAGRWFVFLILLSAVALGTGFFIKSFMEEIESLQSNPSGTELQQPNPAESESSSVPASASATPEAAISEIIFDDARKLAVLETPQGLDRATNQPLNEEIASSEHGEMNHKPTTSDKYFVVLLSTKSKDKAIERAKTLRVSGYAGEVILSSSGYYGVVLRHDSSEQAEASMKAIVTSGVTKEKPYIMTDDRVKESIYPKAE